MKYYVKFDCLGKMSEGSPEQILKGQELIGRQIEHIEKSGKMKDGGPLLGTRGGYFILDVNKPAEILGLLGRVFLENFNIEIHPVLSFKEMSEFMQEEYKKAA